MNLPQLNPQPANKEQLHLIARVEQKCGILSISERKHGKMRCYGDDYLWTLSRFKVHEFVCIIQKADDRQVFHRDGADWFHVSDYTSDDVKVVDRQTGKQINIHREDVN